MAPFLRCFHAQVGRIAVQRERCLARVRAQRRASSSFSYEYAHRGGWVEVRDGRRLPPVIIASKKMQSD